MLIICVFIATANCLGVMGVKLQGGVRGAERLSKSRLLKKLLKEQELAGRIYGAISSSPTVLQKQGLLKVLC